MDPVALADAIVATAVEPPPGAAGAPLPQADAPAATSPATAAPAEPEPPRTAGPDSATAQPTPAAHEPQAGTRYQTGTGQYHPDAQQSAQPRDQAGVPPAPDPDRSGTPGAENVASTSAPSAESETSVWVWNWTTTCDGTQPDVPEGVLPKERSPSIWVWNWSWNCGNGNDAGAETDSGIPAQYQNSSIQYQPTNVNISLRVDSPGDDGPVTQANVASTSVSSTVASSFSQTAVETQVTFGPAAGDRVERPPDHVDAVGMSVAVAAPAPELGVGIAVGFEVGVAVSVSTQSPALPLGGGPLMASPAGASLGERSAEQAPRPRPGRRPCRAPAGAACGRHLPASVLQQAFRAPPAAPPPAAGAAHERVADATGRSRGHRRAPSPRPVPAPVPVPAGMGPASSAAAGGGSGSIPVAALVALVAALIFEFLRVQRASSGRRPSERADEPLERPG